ncbi:MAG: flagellar basal body-associated FliL family protein [Nitrospirae bacterium]|nr:flagellar basal body-associated FliL family protein [Nitrospirota bacterium]
MADEIAANQDNQTEQVQEIKPKKFNKKLIIIIAGAFLVLIISGFITYMVLHSSGKSDGASHKNEETSVKATLVPIEPLILNLSEQGRFLKITMQFEISDPSYQQFVSDYIPQLKDAIIILISSKSSDSISSPEGKLQLKDEILLRANQTVGKDIFKNLYFTEFVMQ